MKILKNRKIQAEVDKRPSHTITHLTVAHKCVVTLMEAKNVTDLLGIGVDLGLFLAAKFADRQARTLHVAIERKMRGEFGIYVAKQDTYDGIDFLFFIGTPAGIVERLQDVPVPSPRKVVKSK